jgi:hypothetical protein
MRTAAHSRVPAPAVLSAARTTLLLAILSLLHLACAPGAAQHHAIALDDASGRWRELGRTEQGILEIDAGSLDSIDDDVFQVRTRWRFLQPQRELDGTVYQSSVAVRVIDCRSGRLALLAFANRDGARATQTASQPLFAARWDLARPESLSARIVGAACGETGRGPLVAAAGREQPLH